MTGLEWVLAALAIIFGLGVLSIVAVVLVLRAVFRRIRQEGVALDAQLQLMESETDATVLAEELPAAGRRVEQVTGLVRRLRSAVASGLAGVTDDTLTLLRADVDREVAALHAGVAELHELNRRDERFEPTPLPSNDRQQRSSHEIGD